MKALNVDELRANLELRLKKACNDFITAVVEKHSIKQMYRQQATGGRPSDMVTAMGKMTSDMRYKIAKDDWLDAMAEMKACSSALQALRDMS